MTNYFEFFPQLLRVHVLNNKPSSPLSKISIVIIPVIAMVVCLVDSTLDCLSALPTETGHIFHPSWRITGCRNRSIDSQLFFLAFFFSSTMTMHTNQFRYVRCRFGFFFTIFSPVAINEHAEVIIKRKSIEIWTIFTTVTVSIFFSSCEEKHFFDVDMLC
jgi:hypothetical protein